MEYLFFELLNNSVTIQGGSFSLPNIAIQELKKVAQRR
jgi:hypothetical protein